MGGALDVQTCSTRVHTRSIDCDFELHQYTKDNVMVVRLLPCCSATIPHASLPFK